MCLHEIRKKKIVVTLELDFFFIYVYLPTPSFSYVAYFSILCLYTYIIIIMIIHILIFFLSSVARLPGGLYYILTRPSSSKYIRQTDDGLPDHSMILLVSISSTGVLPIVGTIIHVYVPQSHFNRRH